MTKLTRGLAGAGRAVQKEVRHLASVDELLDCVSAQWSVLTGGDDLLVGDDVVEVIRPVLLDEGQLRHALKEGQQIV